MGIRFNHRTGAIETSGNLASGNYEFDTDQTVGAGQDNYVLTYDDATGLISLEAVPASGGAAVLGTTTQTDTYLYLNRNHASDSVLHIAQIGVGPIASFGKAPSLGSTAYTAQFDINNDGGFTADGIARVNAQILGGSGYGTAALPSFTSTQDSNTGFYVESSDVAAISTGGIKRLDVASTGLDLHVPLSIDGLVDNDVLIHFNMDRPWTLLSKGEDALNQLELQSINDKHFVISDSLGAVQFTLETDSGDLIVANNVEANTVLGQAAASGLVNSFNAISNGPSVYWSESDQAVDNKGWKMWGSGGAFKFYTTNDSGVATSNIFEVQRTGTTVDKVLFGTPIQTNSIIETNPGTGFAQLTERALFLDGKSVVEQADTSWLRLNQNGDFTSGIYTPNNMRVDGRIFVSSTIYIENGTTGSIQIGDTGITPTVDIGCRNSSYCHFDTTASAGFYYYKDIDIVGTKNITKASHGNYLYHQGTYNADQAGGVTFSTSAASGGVSGDIWFKYT